MKQCLTGTALLFAIAACTNTVQAADSSNTAKPTLSALSTTHYNFYRNDAQHSGYVDSTIAFPLNILWKHTMPSTADSLSSPIFANGVVYYCCGNELAAVDAKSGAEIWRYTTTGKPAGRFLASPALAHGFIYAGADDGTLIKFDAKSGKRLFGIKTDGPIRSSPIADGGLVYFGSDDGNVYAISTTTDEVAWKFNTAGPVVASPALAGSTLIVESADGTIYGLDESTGRELWNQRLSGDGTSSPPVVSDDVAYFGSGSDVEAITARSGGVRWRSSLANNVANPISVGNDSLYVASQDNILYALTSRGRARWSAQLNTTTEAPALISRNAVIIPEEYGIVSAYNETSGKLMWQDVIKPSHDADTVAKSTVDIASSPLYADGTLFVLGDDGSLTAFRSDTPDRIPPTIGDTVPSPGGLAAGKGIAFKVDVSDDGTGVDPASIVWTIDGKKITKAKYDPTKNAVVIDTVGDFSGKAQPALDDGHHESTITVKDWRGNVATHTWGFTVDNTLDPKSTDSNNQGPGFNPGENGGGNPYAGGGNRNGGRPGERNDSTQPPPPPPI